MGRGDRTALALTGDLTMAAISAVGSVSPANETQEILVKYQQKLAADLAAKAGNKVIIADKDALARAQHAVRQAQQPSSAGTGDSSLDFTV
jgi:hypothetical protein